MKAPVAIALILLNALLRPALAHSRECNPTELSARLQTSDGAYSDAMELAKILTERSFTLNCVLRSKMVNLFEHQSGAALYRTDYGDFDVLFLATTQSFAGLKIIDHRLKNGYSYSFTGAPRPAWNTNRMESGYRMYFLKSANRLLVINDSKLFACLEKILTNR